MDAVQETQFSDDEMMDDDDHLVAEQSPHEHPVIPNNTDIVFVVAHKQLLPMADTALHSAAGAAASQRRPPLGATTTSPQHPLAVTTDLLTDSSFPQTRRLSSSQRVRSGNSLLYGNGVGGGSGSFTPQSNPNVALGPHHHIKQVSVTHDDYLHTNVKPTAYHSAFCGCGLGCQSSERSLSPSGGGKTQQQQQHNGSTTLQVSRFERNEYEENCCCFLSHRTDSRWWQGCCETLFCFPCVVASQRKFLLYGPPNAVASPLSPPPSAVPAHVRARLNASALAASQVAAASGAAPPLPAGTLVKQTSGSSFDNGAGLLQEQEFTQSCSSRCCYSDCVLATLVPCVAVGFAVENRYLMAKYHMISDDNNNNNNTAVATTTSLAEGIVPDSNTARSPRVPSRNGSLISAATPTPQLRVYQSRPPPTSAANCFSWSSCLFPCCSVAQVGRELEMRGVGDQVRLRAPVTATMGLCCTETHHDDDSPLKNTPSSAAQATPPPTIVTTTTTTTTSSRGNQLPATTAAAPLPTSSTSSPSTTNGASPGYVQQKNNTAGATNVPNYHLTTDNNNNSLSQSFRPSGGGAQTATTIANGKGEDFIWVPFYPEVATKEMMQRMSRDFWRHAPPPSHTSMNFSRNNNDLLINSIRAGSPAHNASGAARRNVMAPTARLSSGDAFLPPPSRTPTGLGETTIPPVASPTDIRNNPLVVRRPSRQLEVEEDDVDEELSQHVFPERGGGGGVSGLVDPRAGFYPQNHIAMLLGA